MANVLVEKSYIKNAHDAVREKLGSQDLFTPAELADKIASIPQSGPSSEGLQVTATFVTDNAANFDWEAPGSEITTTDNFVAVAQSSARRQLDNGYGAHSAETVIHISGLQVYDPTWSGSGDFHLMQESMDMMGEVTDLGPAANFNIVTSGLDPSGQYSLDVYGYLKATPVETYTTTTNLEGFQNMVFTSGDGFTTFTSPRKYAYRLFVTEVAFTGTATEKDLFVSNHILRDELMLRRISGLEKLPVSLSLRNAKFLTSDVAFPDGVTYANSYFLNSLTHPITINVGTSSIASAYASVSLNGMSGDALSQGVTIKGANRAQWLAALPNGPARKLIDGGE